MAAQHETLLDLITSSWKTQAICAAVQLGIFEHIGAHEMEAEDVALHLRTNSSATLRLMRALTTIGLLLEEHGKFRLTDEGARLREDHPQSLRNWALWWAQFNWNAWGRLSHCIQTGQSSRSGFDLLNEDPDAAAIFQRAMAELTQLSTPAIVCAVDWTKYPTIMDIGGGTGELLNAIVGASGSHGILFETAAALTSVRSTHLQMVAGDFFESIPNLADAYILKSVLHDWPYRQAANILTNLRSAAAPHAVVFVIERIADQALSQNVESQSFARADLHMLVAHGSGERSAKQWQALYDEANFTWAETIPCGNGLSIMKLSPKVS